MKKLLLLLILSFFSVQSLAGSCPDGSDPVKSISADGTYFVYNCESSSHAAQALAKQKASVLNCGTNDAKVIPNRWTCFESPLMGIEIPNDWSLIDDYDKYQDIISANGVPRMGGYPNNPLKDECIDMFHNMSNFKWGTETATGLRVGSCLEDLRNRLYEGGKQDGTEWTDGREYTREVLEWWAREDSLKQPKDSEIGSGDYAWIVTMQYVTGIYAQEKDNVEFSDTFKAWLETRLLNSEFKSFDRSPNNIGQKSYRCKEILGDFKMPYWINDCSTTRFAYTEMMVVGGLALNNKEIFNEGIDSLQYITSLFNDENIYPLAARGVKAMSYYTHVPVFLSSFAVILDSVNYDFLEHEMPNGFKVHEAIGFSFDNIWEDDLSIFWPYIQMNLGTNNSTQFIELLKPKAERDHYVGYFASPPQKNVRSAINYVEEYQPELKDRFGYELIYSKFVKGTEDISYYDNNPSFYSMWDSTFFDIHSIYQASDKVSAVALATCEASGLDGTYMASWYFIDGRNTVAVDDNKDPSFAGSEPFIVDGCKGKFESVQDFNPSIELRKKLKVIIEPNGLITIAGDLHLWDEEWTYPTVLKGDLNSGEILDYFGDRTHKTDLIWIKFVK